MSKSRRKSSLFNVLGNVLGSLIKPITNIIRRTPSNKKIIINTLKQYQSVLTSRRTSLLNIKSKDIGVIEYGKALAKNDTARLEKIQGVLNSGKVKGSLFIKKEELDLFTELYDIRTYEGTYSETYTKESSFKNMILTILSYRGVDINNPHELYVALGGKSVDELYEDYLDRGGDSTNFYEDFKENGIDILDELLDADNNDVKRKSNESLYNEYADFM